MSAQRYYRLGVYYCQPYPVFTFHVGELGSAAIADDRWEHETPYFGAPRGLCKWATEPIPVPVEAPTPVNNPDDWVF